MHKFMDKVKAYILKTSESPADMLFYTSILGWALSSAAQVVAVVCNEKLSKKEKSFLVPQEIFDGVLNIGTYALVTVNAINFAKEKFKKNPILNIKGDRYVAPAVTVASIAAGAVASNIITPIVRNYLGAAIQKKFVPTSNTEKPVLNTKQISIPQINKPLVEKSKKNQAFLYPTTMNINNKSSMSV